jgi:hypothetical protein
MQGLWCGDRRDRVGWDALLHLAKNHSTPRIVQVAYYRDGIDQRLHTPASPIAMPSAVWEHFVFFGEAASPGLTVVDNIGLLPSLWGWSGLPGRQEDVEQVLPTRRGWFRVCGEILFSGDGLSGLHERQRASAGAGGR